jgi:hypothetical protein
MLGLNALNLPAQIEHNDQCRMTNAEGMTKSECRNERRWR